MSRSAPVITSTLPVAPGTSVVTPMYTSVGFNAGDYVYQYGANLVGWPKGATTGMSAENSLIGGTVVTAFKQTLDSRSVSYGPFIDQITYAGTTNTTGQIVVSPTTLSGTTFASGDSRCAVLTDGRVAYAYRTGANTLTTAIYSAAGVLQGSTQQLTTQFNPNRRTFTMCALPDGGFIVGWYDNTAGNARYSRLNSSNGLVVSDAIIVGSFVNGLCAAATQSYYAFSYHVDASSQAHIKSYTVSGSSALGTYTLSQNTFYASACAGTNSDTFYLAAGDSTNNSNYIAHVNGGSLGLLGSLVNTSTYTNGFTYAGCGSTANSTYSGAYAATFLLNNSSGQALIVRVYATTATTPTVTASAHSLTGYTGNVPASIGSINNGACVLVYRNSINGDLRYQTFGASTSTINGGVLVSGNNGDFTLGVSGIPGGTFAFAYSAATTGYSSFGSAYSATYTNGVTLMTNSTAYTPSNGYYVLGVALTTAAAGSTGMVATNGSANLSATYPVLPSNILFDSTGTAFTARSAINAQRGNVIGTNVTLRGLE